MVGRKPVWLSPGPPVQMRFSSSFGRGHWWSRPRWTISLKVKTSNNGTILLKNLAKTPVWWPAFTKPYLYTLKTPWSFTRVKKMMSLSGLLLALLLVCISASRLASATIIREFSSLLFVTFCPQYCTKTFPRKTQSHENQCITLVATA